MPPHCYSQVADRLPLVEVAWKPPRPMAGDESEGMYEVEVTLRRLGRPGKTLPRVYAPRFPKVRPQI